MGCVRLPSRRSNRQRKNSRRLHTRPYMATLLALDRLGGTAHRDAIAALVQGVLPPERAVRSYRRLMGQYARPLEDQYAAGVRYYVSNLLSLHVNRDGTMVRRGRNIFTLTHKGASKVRILLEAQQ